MKRKIKKLNRLIRKKIDAIYKTSKSIAKQWDKNTIPLSTLKTMIDKTKLPQNTGDDFVDKNSKAHNKCLDTFYESCLQVAKNMNSKDIPITEIQKGVNIIKTVYA